MPARIAVYALTRQGLALALRIARACRGDVFAVRSLHYLPKKGDPAPVFFTSLADRVRSSFPLYSGHVFVAATGIVVRVIAPLLASKTRDPAVLAVDQRGRFVISLLSGHLGGANALTHEVAKELGAVPVITTATDVEGLPAIDSLAVERGLAIGNPAAIKAVNAALLAGAPVTVHDPENRLGLIGGPWEDLFPQTPEWRQEKKQPHPPTVLVTEKERPEHPLLLTLHPRILCAGIGCRKGTPADTIERHVRDTFTAAGLCLASLACLASATIKKDEPGIWEAARNLGVPVRFFPSETLAKFPVSVPSPKALETFGLKGICEPAALAAACAEAYGDAPLESSEIPLWQSMATLLLPKRAGNGVTLAVARVGRSQRSASDI